MTSRRLHLAPSFFEVGRGSRRAAVRPARGAGSQLSGRTLAGCGIISQGPSIDILHVTRYVASVGLTVAGALSLVVELRNSADKRLTRLGVWMMVAIIGFGTLLVVVQIVSDVRDQRQRSEEAIVRAADRHSLQNLEEQLARASIPLDQIRVGYWFGVSEVPPYWHTVGPDLFPYHAELPKYLRRVRAALAPYLTRTDFIYHFKSLGISAGGTNSYIICRGSPLFPNAKVEPHLYATVTTLTFNVQIFRRPLEGSEHPWISGDRSHRVAPDMEFRFHGSIPGRSEQCPLCGCIWLEPDHPNLSVATQVQIDRSTLVTNGKLTSVRDLAGAQIFVQPWPVVSDYERLGLSLRQFSIKPGTFAELFLPLKKHSIQGGFVYDFTFPKQINELESLNNHGMIPD